MMRTSSKLSAAVALFAVASAAPKAANSAIRVEDGYAPGADGVRLFYRRAGTGPDTVVFLHGGPGASTHDGGEAIEPLAGKYTIILYDQRGGGRSEIITDASRLTAQDHVRDLEALRQHFKLQRFSLVGLSWGSALAALYASQHPEHLTRIVFLAPMPPARVPYLQQRIDKTNSKLTSAEVSRARAITQLYATASDTEAVTLCREQFRLINKPYQLKPALPSSPPPEICNVPPAAIKNFWVVNAAVFKSLGNYDLRPQLAAIKVPVLVIEGARSVVPLDATREWVRSTPNARLLLVPGAGHGVFFDQPAALQRAVREFLDGRWPEGTATRTPYKS